jgi:hypothetical protein
VLVLLGSLLGFVLLIVWVLVLVDAVRRPDLSTTAKVLWALGVFILPFIGAVIYMIARPAQPGDRALAAAGREGDAPLDHPVGHGPA